MTTEKKYETFEDLLAEKEKLLSKEVNYLESRHGKERLAYLDLIIKAYQELNSLIGSECLLRFWANENFASHRLTRLSLFEDDSFYVCFNPYRPTTKYDFSGRSQHYSFLLGQDRIKEPNAITIGKATRKKLLSWVYFAKEVNRRETLAQAEIKANREKSIETLKSLGETQFETYGSPTNKGNIVSICNNFSLSWEIRANGKLNARLETRYLDNEESIDVFKKIQANSTIKQEGDSKDEK